MSRDTSLEYKIQNTKSGAEIFIKKLRKTLSWIFQLDAIDATNKQAFSSRYTAITWPLFFQQSAQIAQRNGEIRSRDRDRLPISASDHRDPTIRNGFIVNGCHVGREPIDRPDVDIYRSIEPDPRAIVSRKPSDITDRIVKALWFQLVRWVRWYIRSYVHPLVRPSVHRIIPEFT